jgi:hypothetical protein
MRAELERIWVEEPIAYACHIAGWFERKPNRSRYIFKSVGLLLVRKCKKLNFKIKRLKYATLTKTSRYSKRTFKS